MAQAIYELDSIGVDGALEAVAIHWYCNEGCASRAKIEGPTSTGENNDAEDGAVCETCGKEIDTTVSLADVMDAPHNFFKAVYSDNCICGQSKASSIHQGHQHLPTL